MLTNITGYQKVIFSSFW